MLAEQSFGMFNICKEHILFELFSWKKKKEDEQKLKFSGLVFSTMLNVSRTFRVDLALE